MHDAFGDVVSEWVARLQVSQVSAAWLVVTFALGVTVGGVLAPSLQYVLELMADFSAFCAQREAERQRQALLRPKRSAADLLPVARHVASPKREGTTRPSTRSKEDYGAIVVAAEEMTVELTSLDALRVDDDDSEQAVVDPGGDASTRMFERDVVDDRRGLLAGGTRLFRRRARS